MPEACFADPRPPCGTLCATLPEADDYEELLHRDWVKARFKKSTPTALLCAAKRRSEDYSDTARVRREPAHVQPAHRSHRSVEEALSRTKPGDTEPVSRFHKLDPEGRLQHDSRRDGQRPRRVHFAAAHTSLFAAMHHRARSGAPALLSRLVPLSRDEVARIPADRQLRAAAACQGRGVEGARSVSGSQKSPKLSRCPGRLRLLSFGMSDAAAHYGVPPDVVPKRIRVGQGARRMAKKEPARSRRRSRTATPPSSARYFKNHYKPGKTQFEFSRDEFVEIAQIA
jgi:DNA (cytosine-5)-methyltransferase 1